jgi:fibronectin type 3 domain-containing protein
MKLPIHKLTILFGCLFGLSAFANVPGGGTNGPNVTLTDNGSTVTLANGTVSIVVTKADASIHQIYYTYNNGAGAVTNQLLANGYSGGKFYWENSNNEGLTFTNWTVADPANNGGNYAEIALTSTTVSNDELEVHYSMLRGSTGFYVTPIWSHRSSDGTFSMGECRDNIYAGAQFNWMSVDATRNRLMEVQPGTSAIGVLGAPKEVSLWTNGIYAGRYEDKYKYSADLGAQRVWGWSSVGAGGSNVGLWNITASPEYYNGGPMKRELMEHIGTTILNMLNGSHYGGGTDGSFAAGEVWTKVYGPYFIYCNNISDAVTDTNQAAQALYSDALAQAAAEATAWPYSWFTNANYAPASDRGTVTGRMVIYDSYNPNASAAGLWVGVVQQPATSTADYDFQEWMKPYQFWVKTDTNGNFSISNVIAGANYTLYAFGPGAAGTFQSQAQSGGSAPNTVDIPASPFSVTVTGGATNNLGTVTWTPTRVGPTVFEIGYPDRTAAKFRHGEDWWVGDLGPSPAYPSPIWSKWLEYPFDFPNGPDYIVGQSRWTTDWNFCQPVVTDGAGNYNPSTSTITFNLASAPAGGSQASFYIALASDYQGPLIIQVNGNNIAGSTGYFPPYSSSANESDATIREGIHGIFTDNRINFSGSLLQAGQNTITINMRKGGYFANHAMYDYLRLELTGYTPPPPSTLTAYAGNNCNLICWPVQPGATSYNILRSTTAGGGYAPVATGVTGPVCGSGWNNATFLDTTAANGMAYYYVVQSVNPVGTSADSPESPGVTPDAAVSTSAPAAPTGLTVSSAGHQSVALNWNASAGANFYTVYRSTLFDNGGGASNVLGTIVLASNVTGTSYTDTSPTDGSIYSYSVTAAGAGGASSNSSSAVAVPLPAPPAGAPGTLTATPSSVTNITLSWSAVSGAVGYVVQRATSLNGTYLLLNSITETIYTDHGLNTNLTYYYRITPVNAGGIGTSGLTTTKPAAPASLTAFAGNTEIFLVWPGSVGATGYVIHRGTSSGNETTTVASGVTGTNYLDSGLTDGTAYYYVVSATGSAANSGNSPEASATPGSLAPPTIAKINVAGGNFSLAGTGGFPTATYHVLATTNLALPAAQWTPVATNQFDSSGNFAITNTINPAWPQTFYRLQSQ